jgi:hypothetical protein
MFAIGQALIPFSTVSPSTYNPSHMSEEPQATDGSIHGQEEQTQGGGEGSFDDEQEPTTTFSITVKMSVFGTTITFSITRKMEG